MILLDLLLIVFKELLMHLDQFNIKKGIQCIIGYSKH